MRNDDEVRRPTTAGGGMTEATGSLTPEGVDEEFVPAERRAIESPAGDHAVSAGARERAAGSVDPEDAPGPMEDREPQLGGDEESPPERY